MENHQRALPRETASEAWVLGSILMNPDRMDDVISLRPSDFADERYSIVFQSMLELHATGKPIDEVTLSKLLRGSARMNQLTEGNVVAVLHELAEAAPVPSHAMYHAERVRDSAMRRGIILACEAAACDGYTSDCQAAELLGKVEAKLQAVEDDRASESVTHAHEVANEAMAALAARMEGEKEPEGVPTGFIDLDKMLVTMRPGELTILAARPGMGKTALAANVATFAALDRRTPTLFVSLEMSRLELADRVLSGRASVRLSDMRSGRISKEQRTLLVEATAELGHGTMWIDDSPSRSALEISATARRLKRRNDLGLLIIDYLQLIDPEDRKMPREQQVATISKRLKRLARELNIPVLCLAQLNRMNESQSDKRPKLSHLRESGAIEQDSDVVLFLFREEYYLSPKEVADKGVSGVAEAIVAKQRNGRTGTAKLCWQEDYTRFVDAAQPWQGGSDWNPRD